MINISKLINLETLKRALTEAKSYTDESVAELTINISDVMEDVDSSITALETSVANKADASTLTSHTNNKSNPHGVTKAQVGLGNVDNTADSAKSVKYATSAGTLTNLTATVAELNFVDGVTSNVQTQLNDKADKNASVFYIEGTGDTAGVWLGSHDDITEYYAGLTIAYKVNIAGASGLTLNINDLGAVSVVRNATSAVTTHYGVSSIVMLVYTIDSSGTAYWKVADYDADTKTRSSNKTGSKMYIIGATTQSTSGQTTYSNKNCYIGTDNALYSAGTKVSVEGHGHTVSEISDLTATATELNYMDGVTSAVQTQLNAKAPLASPTFTGTPKAPTASAGTNTTQLATTAFVTTAITNAIGNAISASY